MQLADLLSECYAVEFDEAWERERTATPVRVFASGFTRPAVHFERHKQFFA